MSSQTSCSATDTTTTTTQSSPKLSNESRGSSVSTEMREEYEDLLRYAVVVPVVHDAKMASMKEHASGGVADLSSSRVQPEPARLRVPKAHQSPLHPEVKVVDSDNSTISEIIADHPRKEQAPPTLDLNQSLSLQASLDTPPPPLFGKPPPPFTAMNVHTHAMPSTSLSHGDQAMSHDMSHGQPRSPRAHEPTLRFDVGRSCDQERGYSDDEGVKNQPPLSDPEMTRLGQKLDTWCLDLKRNILAEFEQSRIRLIECQLEQFREEREKQEYDLQQARAELERYKELLTTYEQSIGRKDHVISNLTRALQKQKENVDLQKTFGSWKLRHIDEKRESFTSRLAAQHYHSKLKGHVWEAWYGVIKCRWKQRFERACQMKAEEVVMELTGQYEDKLAEVNEVLEATRQDVAHLKAQRDLYEENMKKAFMRGVCALNMEAMSMFKYGEDKASSNGDDEMPLPPGSAHPPPPPPNVHLTNLDQVPAPRVQPNTIADMRPIGVSECLAIPPKQGHVTTTPTIGQMQTKLMPASILVSRMQHQQGTNREPVEVQWVGREGAGPGKSRRGIMRGGDQPPSVFVQRHSE